MPHRELIYVGPLSAVDSVVDAAGVSHLVTLINQDIEVLTPDTIHPGNHLRLSMNDIDQPRDGLVPPNRKHVGDLIDFVVSWDRSGPMLIHCWAGISRSTAAAYIALCTFNPGISEQAIAKKLRAASPKATPNRRLVSIADEILERDGRMTTAVDAIGRGEMAFEGSVFSLPAQLPA